MVNNAEFVALKQLVKQHGLLDRQPGFSVAMIAVKLGLLGLSVAVLFGVSSVWVQVANAIFLGFVLGQLGFTSHGACHRQCFHTVWKNDLVGIVMGNLLLGISRDWWIEKHNAHHVHPNREGLDPDLDVPVVAFTKDQAQSRRGVARLLVRYQAWMFFPLLTFQSYALRQVSLQFILRGQARQGLLEGLLIALNMVGAIMLPIMALGLWGGLAFTLLSQAVFGVYLGSVFAPNHKGMLIVAEDAPIDFLRLQVLTARNVRSHPLTDCWYGGLNYQIEHHLFPALPMHRLREASVLVKAFCAQHGVSYYETSMIQSYREILAYLDEIGSALGHPEQPSAAPGA
jgi:fatty acid desaturase